MLSIQATTRRLVSFFTVLFLAVSAVLVYWQVAQSATVQQSPYKVCVAQEQPIRGKIFDRNGVLLAWSEPDPKSPCGWRRRYATKDHPSISSFLGYFSYIYGSTGIENYYDDVLTGKSDPLNFGDAAQQYTNRLLHRPIYGADIYLSIDVRVQDELDRDFNSQSGCGIASNAGSIIVEKPDTGELLGVLSRPYFDGDVIGDTAPSPDDATMTVGAAYWKSINQSDAGNPLVNRALQGVYAPGSIFKTITLIAGFDSGKYTVNSTFSQSDATSVVVNGFHIDSNNLGDYKDGPLPPRFPLKIVDAYAYSDNVVFARMGMALGAGTWTDYARRFYLSTPDNKQTIPVDWSSPSRSYIYRTTGLDDPTALATSAYGQGQLFVSPLTMAMITSSVAADGKLATPHFLGKIVPHDTDPNTAGTAVFDTTQVFSAQTASGVRQAMRNVVAFGSVGASGGNIAAIGQSSAQIGGKTGSAQTSDTTPSHAWFIALARDQQNQPAQLATVIMKEYAGEGACQAPISRKVLENGLNLGY